MWVLLFGVLSFFRSFDPMVVIQLHDNLLQKSPIEFVLAPPAPYTFGPRLNPDSALRPGY